jgi:hypothetical protein
MPQSPTTHPIPPEHLKHDYPAHVFPPPEYRPPEYLAYLERAAAAVKTLRLIVYAGMSGFLLLSAYGFFLVYELTVDTHRMVEQATRITEQMQSMALIMSNMHGSMTDIRDSMADLRDDTRKMRTSIGEMDSTMARMDANVNHVANTVALIQHSMRNFDASVSPAAGVMNSFMPWGGRGNSLTPPFAPPAPR